MNTRIKTTIKHYINKLPYMRKLSEELEVCNKELKICLSEIETHKKELEIYKVRFPPGHYYSPIVSIKEVIEREKEIFSITTKEILGVSLNEENQLELLKELHKFYADIPFRAEKQELVRYFFENEYYSYSDAIFLYSVIRHFKPNRIIEVGSGFSSAVILDTNELFLKNKIKLTCIEPNPETLYSLLKETDKNKNEIIVSNIQKVKAEFFEMLTENDILLIDSSHVSKTGSDVNYIMFEILPRLKKGVIIHFHDIGYPFEYTTRWVVDWKGFGWNEAYILKAFLMYNKQFQIILFTSFLEYFHEGWFETNMPLCLRHKGGSLWIRKE